MARFAGKVVLITGAASGIGKASALRIASEGGQIACVDRDEVALKTVVDEIGKLSGSAQAFVCDITHEEAVKSTVMKVIQRLGQIDALCNIAGVLRFDHTHEVAMSDYDTVMNVNARGTLMMCKAAIPHLLKTKGFIVNMSSSAALGAHAWTIAYSASKGAVLSMTKCIAVEYMLQGLNCNAVCPAGIETPMTEDVELPVNADMRLLQKVMLPDGSFSPANDVASVVAFLACEDANHINGEQIRVDGGLMT